MVPCIDLTLTMNRYRFVLQYCVLPNNEWARVVAPFWAGFVYFFYLIIIFVNIYFTLLLGII